MKNFAIVGASGLWWPRGDIPCGIPKDERLLLPTDAEARSAHVKSLTDRHDSGIRIGLTEVSGEDVEC